MPEQLFRGFSLFPLGIVALPGESVPLHIFEDRYLRMIEKCLLADVGSVDREFGIVWLSDEELKQIGCACEIEETLERLEDGRLNILARGTRPFRLVERQDDLPYPAGVVGFLLERVEEADEGAALRPWALYRELVEQAPAQRLEEADLRELDSYRMAGTVEFDAEAKQELL